MIIRSPRLQAGKFVFSDAKRLLQHYRRKAAVHAQQHLVVDKHELEMEPVGD